MDIARETALKILYKIDEEKAYSNIVLNSEIKKQKEKLQRKDIGLISEIVYGVTTWRITWDEIIEKYVEMNVAHPFREDNGRSTHIWLDHILKNEIGKVIDWSKIDKEDYLLAMEKSPIKNLEIKYLLKNALTDEINSREVYMKGIDHSYYYEGYITFKAEDL